MLRNLPAINYLPLLSVRPAEMVALRELPGGVHEAMLPHILFRPWLGSGTLGRAFDKLSHSYPNNAFVLELDPEHDASGNSPLSIEIKSLRSAPGGFPKWIEFCRQHPRVIPCLQASSDEEALRLQVEALSGLGRGIAIRVPKAGLTAVGILLRLFSAAAVEDALFVLDFGQTDHRYLVDLAIAINETRRILDAHQGFYVSISSTSFPSSFTEITEQEIFERSFFNAVKSALPDTESRLLYSDRGSARLPSRGGGGVPAPRIDLPKNDEWRFFRKDLPPDSSKRARLQGYKEMAAKAVGHPAWDPAINIWGTQMIKLTELGSEYGITSPVRSTAARINIHLFRQSLLGIQDRSAISLEDDWVD